MMRIFREPEALYPSQPYLSDWGECIHFEKSYPPIPRCTHVKDAIKKKKIFIFREMMKHGSTTSIHALNENIWNLEILLFTWESYHFSPCQKWKKDWISKAPWEKFYTAYLSYKRSCGASHCENKTYDLASYEDFPPLCGGSELMVQGDHSSPTPMAEDKACRKMSYSQGVGVQIVPEIEEISENIKN